ncbi:DUF192 domain-containing protein [Vreelandella utahensis]|uniref:DUF192 domain-containing protein n=1 Tax=Vreelandella halophila TaxID=86177 RepID=UPI003BF5E2F7
MARSFRERAIGLLGCRRLSPQQGLYFERCRSVHMFGMRFPVDVLFLDEDGVVVRTVPALRPWRITGCRRAEHTVELAAGMIDGLRLQTGQCLSLRRK